MRQSMRRSSHGPGRIRDDRRILTDRNGAFFRKRLTGASYGSFSWRYPGFSDRQRSRDGHPDDSAYIIAVTWELRSWQIRVALLAAHLFVFYYAVLSDLTPPDAITAFAPQPGRIGMMSTAWKRFG